MAIKTPAVDNASNRASGKSVRMPPEEQFWQRYSPHHEAPLSGVGSFALHFLAIGFLALAAYLGWLGLGRGRGALPVDTVRLQLGGGGGHKQGSGDNPGDGSIGTEAVNAASTEQDTKPADPTAPARPDLKDPAVVAKQLPTEFAANDDVKRYIKEGNENLAALSQLDKAVQTRLRDGLKPAGAGGGGSGKDGGTGKGVGTGTGDGRGEGTGNLTQREKRMLRWTMQFDTRSGHDYLRQLQGLGAILAIPRSEPATDYWIIRDLDRRPPQLLDEDVSKIQRIFWIDDKPPSVASMMRALNVDKNPSHFVAFMPPELEDKLFQLELKFKGLKEDDIFETQFRVDHVGGKYVPRVIGQRQK